jgi:hypothetical protein
LLRGIAGLESAVVVISRRISPSHVGDANNGYL